MKKIYTLLSLAIIFSLNMQAQLTLTKAANEPVIGDVRINKTFDTVSVFPKSSGVGQSWNFANLTANTSTETTTYTSVAASPSPGLFSNASLASNRGGTEWELLKSNASTLEYADMYFSATDIVTFSNTAILYSWPISYGNNTSDLFTATETTGTNVTSWTGTITSNASGSGTVTMPGGGVYNNCLMIKRNIDIVMAGATSTTQVFLLTYEFWSSGFKFPIVNAEYETSITGTVVTKKTPSFWLNTAALPVGLNENTISKSDFNIYPNPASTELNIKLSKDIKNYQIEIIDLTGKVILKSENANKLNISELNEGLYFLSIKNNDFVARKSLVVRR